MKAFHYYWCNWFYLAQVCSWSFHTSRLADVWWSDLGNKKIELNKYTCRGLETCKSICNLKWDATKLMEDIRANFDIPGNALMNSYSRDMVSVYLMKKHVVDNLFGGHNESYTLLPTYVKIICKTNTQSTTFVSNFQTESILRQLLFPTTLIYFDVMWKWFLVSCRPLIVVDETHLKGNYGGVLLSIVALDTNR